MNQADAFDTNGMYCVEIGEPILNRNCSNSDPRHPPEMSFWYSTMFDRLEEEDGVDEDLEEENTGYEVEEEGEGEEVEEEEDKGEGVGVEEEEVGVRKEEVDEGEGEGEGEEVEGALMKEEEVEIMESDQEREMEEEEIILKENEGESLDNDVNESVKNHNDPIFNSWSSFFDRCEEEQEKERAEAEKKIGYQNMIAQDELMGSGEERAVVVGGSVDESNTNYCDLQLHFWSTFFNCSDKEEDKDVEENLKEEDNGEDIEVHVEMGEPTSNHNDLRSWTRFFDRFDEQKEVAGDGEERGKELEDSYIAEEVGGRDTERVEPGWVPWPRMPAPPSSNTFRFPENSNICQSLGCSNKNLEIGHQN